MYIVMLMVKLMKFLFKLDKIMMFLIYNYVIMMKKWLLIS